MSVLAVTAISSTLRNTIGGTVHAMVSAVRADSDRDSATTTSGRAVSNGQGRQDLEQIEKESDDSAASVAFGSLKNHLHTYGEELNTGLAFYVSEKVV